MQTIWEKIFTKQYFFINKVFKSLGMSKGYQQTNTKTKQLNIKMGKIYKGILHRRQNTDGQ